MISKEKNTHGNLPFTILEDPLVLDPQTSGPGSSIGVLHSATQFATFIGTVRVISNNATCKIAMWCPQKLYLIKYVYQ